jgi:hypothetical protein
MSQRLTPSFVQLTQDALLKAFWYKPAFRLFLQQHRIKDSSLAVWHADQSKRDFVAWLFPRLLKVEAGHMVVLDMARSLSEMEHFPDLERHEDSKQKLRDARIAVQRLKVEVQKIDAKLNEDKDAARRRKEAQARTVAHQQAALSISRIQEDLVGLIPQQGTKPGGFAFEKWFYNLAIFFELQARPPYKSPDGRQIDGALTHGGTTFLIETKFTKEQIDLTHIDSFMAKINSKSDNTMGIMVSMAGFEDGAIRAASKERTPMLLLDHSHFFGLIFTELMTLQQVIERIKRHASQTGESHLPANKF